MVLPENFWVLFIANLPVVIALFVAQQKGWFVLGITHNKNIEDKDKEYNRVIADKDREIAFREQLRQEVLLDREVLQERDKEKTEALRELTEVVQQTLKLNDRLLNETLNQGWDGNDRREGTSQRTRRGA